jgi:hypothetical protein
MANIKVTSRMTIKQTSAGGSPPVDTVEMGGQGEEEKMPDVNEKKKNILSSKKKRQD